MITLWHNPRCSKSRAALALLEDSGAEVAVRRYLEDAPSEDELRAAQAALGLPVVEMMRQKDALFRDLALKEADDAALLAAMAVHPALIERPVVFGPKQAVIARPPERALEVMPDT